MAELRFFLVVAALAIGSAGSLAQITLPTNGSDLGAQINAAVAELPANGGKIIIQNQASGECYRFSVPAVITKAVLIAGQGPSTCLQFEGTGSAFSFTTNNPTFLPIHTYGDGFGLRDLSLVASGPGSEQTALTLGGPNYSVGFYGSGLTISNFGLGLRFKSGVWNFKIEHSIFGQNTQNVLWPSSLKFGGENLEFDDVTFVGSTFVDSLNFNAGSSGYSNMNNLTFVSCNFDDAQLVIGNGSGSVRLYSAHFENPALLSGSEPFVRILASTVATDVVMDGPDFYNDQNNPYPPAFIEIDGSPTVTITQMRSVNLDGSTNVPANLAIFGNANVTLLGDAPLRAAQQQYIIQSGNPQMWVMGGQDASNKIVTPTPLMYSQSYGPDSQSPVVQIGGDAYEPAIGFNLWSGNGSSYYGMQIRETGPNELDFCSNGSAAIGAGQYGCNAGVVNGVFVSAVQDGIAPLSVASHTPPNNLNAWPATYAASGAQLLNPHVTTGKIILPAAGQITVVFQGNAIFANVPSCTVTYQTTSQFTVLAPLSFNSFTNSITIFGQPYIGAYYLCVG